MAFAFAWPRIRRIPVVNSCMAEKTAKGAEVSQLQNTS